MADIHDLFKKFNNEISLSTDKQNNLRKGRDALRSKIKTWFTDHDKQQPTFCWQGSFAMKTTVNPINGNEYDLDDGVYLSGYSDINQDSWPSPSTVHSWIKCAVDGHTQKSPVDNDTCVRVVYEAGYHIDYPIYIMQDDVAHLANKTKGWIVSDPKAFKDWFIKKVQDNDEQLRRVVKYMKAWKEYKEVPLKGIEITILAANNFEIYEGRDEKSLRDTLSKIISTLNENFTCVKPVSPGEDLFDGISETKKNKILNGLTELKEALDKAIEEDDPAIASDYMIDMFGERFPKGESPKKSDETTASFIRTSSPGVLRHDGRSA